ncbi:MAG: FGGY-family carbohydrate kinase, partial [Micropruina sp.]|uniref:FGGY-family carbohydrate kinase n=1 Tax=Micropruina sp. TaxID=2737536 RepID=UPI0039E47985
QPAPAAGVRSIGDPPDLGVAALEALGYQAQWVIDVQAGLAGRRPTGLSLSGHPLHRAPLWPRIRATLAGVPTTLTTASEPVAVGAALLAAHRAGLAEAAVLPGTPVEPIAGLAERYAARLAGFVRCALGEPPAGAEVAFGRHAPG